ncbi:hypothetical protein [Achromobacter insolitus]|uniref:hypothetical protein n=1 Tax=Achromobacter insolitus TaxID=217204 RepID=UPI001EEF5D42|nr:hypothetical protein [Achromobacter insolitus]
MDWSEIGKWLAGIIAAVVAGGLTLKLVSYRLTSKKTRVHITSQKNNSAGGDIIGGNSVKTIKK